MNVLKIEYIKWITNKKMVLLLILLAFTKTQVLDTYESMGIKMQKPYNVLEPFIAMCNQLGFSLLIILFFLLILSDFMKNSDLDHTIFFYAGKRPWITGKFMFLLSSSFTYLALLFVFTFIFSIKNGEIGSNWSSVTLDFLNVFPEKVGSYGSEFIDGRLFRQMSLTDASINSFFLNWIYMIILGEVIMILFVLHHKKYGVITAALIVGVGTGVSLLENKIKWLFPSSHANLSTHYQDYFREKNFPVSMTYIIEISFIIIVFFIIVYLSKKLTYFDFEERNS